MPEKLPIMVVLVVKYFMCLKHTALGRLRVCLNVILLKLVPIELEHVAEKLKLLN